MFYDELIIDNFKFCKPIDFLKVLKFLEIGLVTSKRSENEENAWIEA